MTCRPMNIAMLLLFVLLLGIIIPSGSLGNGSSLSRFDKEEWFDTKTARKDQHKAGFADPDHDNEAIKWQTLSNKIKIANRNLKNPDHFSYAFEKPTKSFDFTNLGSADDDLLPGQPAQNFTLDTIAGILTYPSLRFQNESFIFHTFDNRSAFLECLWTSSSSLQAIASSPDTVNYVFMSPSNSAREDAYWMQNQINAAMGEMMRRDEISKAARSSLRDRLHFVTTPTYQLGNWIPGVMMSWACDDHGSGHPWNIGLPAEGCGLTQAVFRSSSGNPAPIILKRLDARYDWLPSPPIVFSSSQAVVLADDGCQIRKDVADKIAVVIDGNCSFNTKVINMQKSSAVGVIVYSKPGEPVQDMNCEGSACDSPPSIPATMIPYSKELIQSLQTASLNVSFQTTPCENFYFAIDRQGLLAEIGWLLYPSFEFFVWQAQWFDYKTEILGNLSQDVEVIPIINSTILQGKTGIVTTVSIPSLTDVSQIELDASLSCPGTRDETCPPWDHIVQLYICCNKSSPLCGMELGRWITPFRRRIGRWLTDVTPLAPLFTSNTCTFQMKLDAWWAAPWKPSLNLRLHRSASGRVRGQPRQILPLFQGGTFNQSYNTNYKPMKFNPPANTQKVVLYAVITGHGSDNNGCGEFCVTSHHFIVNGIPNVITFSNAGTPLGCAKRTPTGVTPNEHGTWLYGRDGWCNGREVDPWVQDITPQLDLRGSNSINYFGWFNGKDPNPAENPGEILMFSYLVMYS